MLQSLTEELVAASVVGEAVAAEVTAEDVTVEVCADVTAADVTSEDVTAAEDVGDTEVPAEVLPGQEHLLFESTHFWPVPGQSRIGHSVGL